MADRTLISWTDCTFNPWIGCTKVSPACDICYADLLAKRNHNVSGQTIWGPTGFRILTVNDNWRKPIQWDREAKVKGVRRRVFCASLSDVFEEWDGPLVDRDGIQYTICSGECGSPLDEHGTPTHWQGAECSACEGPTRALTIDDARRDLFQLIRLTPNLEWQILTKRIERVQQLLPDDWGAGGWQNVWLGTSVENQKYAEHRLPVLGRIPAVVRFASYEPALGPIDFDKVVDGAPLYARLDWVIYGGESGQEFRPDDLDWARQARRQCEAAGVSFFFKQAADVLPGSHHKLDGKLIHSFPTPRNVSACVA